MSLILEDIVKLIPNNDNVHYELYFAVMCAIKRATAEKMSKIDGLTLFMDWANIYNKNDKELTEKSRKAYISCNDVNKKIFSTSESRYSILIFFFK